MSSSTSTSSHGLNAPVSSFTCSVNQTVDSVSCNKNLSTLDLWHQKVGHPSVKIVKNVVSSCNIPVNKNCEFFFYSGCCLGKVHKFPFFILKHSTQGLYN